MSLKNKINILYSDLNLSLEQLNKLSELNKSTEIRNIIETHISYFVFLKELEIELKKEKKEFTKDFLISQFKNIKESCILVNQLYKEEIDK